MEDIDPLDIIVLDESGANLGMSSDYARSEGGTRAKAPKPHDTGEKFSIIAAISISAILAMRYITGAVDGNVFVAFIKELTAKLKIGQYVVMDNVSFHKQEIIKSLIESVGAKVVFLPPYSPELSPIEKMWSKIKDSLKRSKARTSAQFHNALASAAHAVNEDDLHGWYAECGYSVA